MTPSSLARFSRLGALVWSVAFCVACTPALNWREVALTGSPLLTLLPCKADKAEREVALAQLRLPLRMVGCEVQGITYAVAQVQPGQASQAAEVLSAWRAATLAAWGQPQLTELPAPRLPSVALPGHGRVLATGRGPSGQPLAAQAAWWVHLDGGQAYVVQAVALGEHLDAAAADAFFDGLRQP